MILLVTYPRSIDSKDWRPFQDGSCAAQHLVFILGVSFKLQPEHLATATLNGLWAALSWRAEPDPQKACSRSSSPALRPRGAFLSDNAHKQKAPRAGGAECTALVRGQACVWALVRSQLVAYSDSARPKPARFYAAMSRSCSGTGALSGSSGSSDPSGGGFPVSWLRISAYSLERT